MRDATYEQDVNAHYTTADLEALVLKSIKEMGKENGPLTPEDLAPIDQFHVGGREATIAMAKLAGITAATKILDAGGGLGGPARMLAAEYGCSVTVLDLTEAFCTTGAMLTERTGLSHLVRFTNASALDLPFDDGSFDLVWTQHSSMNIEDKETLYSEIARVTRPGGRLALHEIMAGPVQPVIYPAPWARDASISFLRRPEEIRALLAGLGYREVAWDDLTAAVAASPRAIPAPTGAVPTIALIAGADFPQRAANLRQNLAEGRVVVIRGVLDRS